MEAHEIGEAIAEGAHESHGTAAAHAAAGRPDDFRRLAAVLVGIIGMLLAIAALGGEYFMKETINSNILASDTYAFYQARNIRQTSFQLAADGLENLLAGEPGLSETARAIIEKRLAAYRATAERYETDPPTGTGKRELLAKAQSYEAHRDEAQRRDLNFDVARAFYEIAIVLGSVSIVAASGWLLGLAGLMAVGATLLSINGYFLLWELPFL